MKGEKQCLLAIYLLLLQPKYIFQSDILLCKEYEHPFFPFSRCLNLHTKCICLAGYTAILHRISLCEFGTWSTASCAQPLSRLCQTQTQARMVLRLLLDSLRDITRRVVLHLKATIQGKNWSSRLGCHLTMARKRVWDSCLWTWSSQILSFNRLDWLVNVIKQSIINDQVVWSSMQCPCLNDQALCHLDQAWSAEVIWSPVTGRSLQSEVWVWVGC